MKPFLAVIFISGAMLVSAQEATRDDPDLVRLLRWLEAAEQHTPGKPDPVAVEIAGWSRDILVTVEADLSRLSLFLQKAGEGGLGASPTIELHDKRFTLAEIEGRFHGNVTLLRGATLHADIASLVEDDFSRRLSNAGDSGVLIVKDGRGSGTRYESSQWEIGRSILDAIKPAVAGNPGAILWYRAVSSYLLREGHFGQARRHLERARKTIPNDLLLLLDTAYFYQALSSGAIQTAVEDLRGAGASPAVDSRRTELTRAERFFREALSLQPDHADARMRLGHTLGLLGRHEDAAVELRTAIDGKAAGEVLYFAELFLGHEEQALGRRDEARRHYENAAELYPRAQSPQLALSQLARASGDREAALRALTILFRLPASESQRWDPWWNYYRVHRERADRLMDQLRAIATTEDR